MSWFLAGMKVVWIKSQTIYKIKILLTNCHNKLYGVSVIASLLKNRKEETQKKRDAQTCHKCYNRISYMVTRINRIGMNCYDTNTRYKLANINTIIILHTISFYFLPYLIIALFYVERETIKILQMGNVFGCTNDIVGNTIYL